MEDIDCCCEDFFFLCHKSVHVSYVQTCEMKCEELVFSKLPGFGVKL